MGETLRDIGLDIKTKEYFLSYHVRIILFNHRPLKSDLSRFLLQYHPETNELYTVPILFRREAIYVSGL